MYKAKIKWVSWKAAKDFKVEDSPIIRKQKYSLNLTCRSYSEMIKFFLEKKYDDWIIQEHALVKECTVDSDFWNEYSAPLLMTRESWNKIEWIHRKSNPQSEKIFTDILK